jgi:hypothetical protein
MIDPYNRLCVIELPVIKPHTVTEEVFMCRFRDGLGYLHICHHKERKYFQCEAAIHLNECPGGYKTKDTIIKGIGVRE